MNPSRFFVIRRVHTLLTMHTAIVMQGVQTFCTGVFIVMLLRSALHTGVFTVMRVKNCNSYGRITIDAATDRTLGS
ncbi:hypothetical protein CXIVA_07090 [Clostridium sp. SY8519]|nr:hypothetical protein CXIVA_07090 [Clostridium sp. SY8519]